VLTIFNRYAYFCPRRQLKSWQYFTGMFTSVLDVNLSPDNISQECLLLSLMST